jgi:hypothetical protein
MEKTGELLRALLQDDVKGCFEAGRLVWSAV